MADAVPLQAHGKRNAEWAIAAASGAIDGMPVLASASAMAEHLAAMAASSDALR